MAPPFKTHDGSVLSAAFSPDSQRIVTASFDKTTRLWDAATGNEITLLQGHIGWVNSAEFSPDGERILTAAEDGTARLWDAATGKEIVSFQGHISRVNSAAFSPDGQRIVTTSDGHRTPVGCAYEADALPLKRPYGSCDERSVQL
jgi:WD40 repeat protein